MAALIATRLYLQVKQALDMSNCRVFFWTDASVAFTWITTEGDWNIFVKNRVKEIRQHTNVEDWRHLPGIMNPADLPSRGCNAKQLLKSKWWEGPAWLKAKESEWPKSQLIVDEREVNKESKKVVLVNTTTDYSTFLSSLTYFSKYTMIVRMVAWILRFSYNCKNAEDKQSGELTCEEFQSAEKRLLKILQTERAEVDQKKMNNLKMFKDEEGLLRIRTKLVLSDEPSDFVCPIYLPGKHVIIQRLALINSRPLTYVADNSDKLKPITPACFTQGLPSSEMPDLDQLDHDSLNRRLRYLHKLREDLRERFRNEYIGMLIQKGKERDSNLRVGDVVLIETDSKRIKWPLGRIVETCWC
ncbi:uncharacterized protein LOC125229780 [Leguminivora glycinivorella]|uniref:uncharacterized protein LOC125229780 n=1 Tax=Leguminivora glycinivorella TaxID=1035111 RepID=UPI00200CD692|nr:uncharacterized protein LOC125229780 [Leguminivora glycinivorella]